jgi:D-beta-D-heptose 7-phosphate kinase/D-beta-D-heptose 1-phosphate adenosyltransferase
MWSGKKGRMRNQNDKVKKLKELLREVKKLKESGSKIVFTNGCFDLLHVGHLRVFREAKKRGDILIVGVNSDASVKKLKGPNRPLVPEKERAELLANLELIDYVVIFTEETPENLIRAIQPDVLVKGADYKLRQIVGLKDVYSHGGKIVRIPILPGHSTSQIIKGLQPRKR